MLQEPPAWLTRSDATRQPMQRDRPGVHGHRQLEALALLLECSVAKAGLSLRVSSAVRKPSPFFVAAFSPTPARFVLLCPPRITTCDSHHHHAALSPFPRRTTHSFPRRINKVNVL